MNNKLTAYVLVSTLFLSSISLARKSDFPGGHAMMGGAISVTAGVAFLTMSGNSTDLALGAILTMGAGGLVSLGGAATKFSDGVNWNKLAVAAEYRSLVRNVKASQVNGRDVVNKSFGTMLSAFDWHSDQNDVQKAKALSELIVYSNSLAKAGVEKQSSLDEINKEIDAKLVNIDTPKNKGLVRTLVLLGAVNFTLVNK